MSTTFRGNLGLHRNEPRQCQESESHDSTAPNRKTISRPFNRSPNQLGNKRSIYVRQVLPVPPVPAALPHPPDDRTRFAEQTSQRHHSLSLGGGSWRPDGKDLNWCECTSPSKNNDWYTFAIAGCCRRIPGGSPQPNHSWDHYWIQCQEVDFRSRFPRNPGETYPKSDSRSRCYGGWGGWAVQFMP